VTDSSLIQSPYLSIIFLFLSDFVDKFRVFQQLLDHFALPIYSSAQYTISLFLILRHLFQTLPQFWQLISFKDSEFSRSFRKFLDQCIQVFSIYEHSKVSKAHLLRIWLSIVVQEILFAKDKPLF
jgi:hypothetical protein